MVYIRIGSCRNCGGCCRILDGIHNLPRQCTAYLPNGNGTHCAIYQTRPEVCRVSPRTPRDLVCLPNCGFQFVDVDTGEVVDGYMLKSTQHHLYDAIQRRNKS